ncbi:uncharacterized protein LOC132061248 [Lycium ferocissimum]|uniref:uncharacterized protein LOC132061248 n=1 Tax=Lycium ferocissimum TaxID=112874 RepID=UPI0028158F55|nr:uncharacterized protein LOC132061248 [Lycium ferocissimum]
METAAYNINGKIWIFVEAGLQMEVLKETDQMLSFKLSSLDGAQDVIMTVTYASTDRGTRIALWEDLCDISTHMHLPWLVGGDFNVITEAAEKYGGLPVQFAEAEDFRHCIDSSKLVDLGFTGSMYTWWNGRSDEACIFKRLDRCLGNQALQNTYPNLEVEHLIKQGSDHSPLLISLKQDSRPIKKSFRFLNFWVEHETFQEVVKNNWIANFSADPFFNFHNKLKKGVQWFKDGDRNTNFFHAHVNGKRRRLQLKRIQDSGGVWLETKDDIAEEAIRFFTNQFQRGNIPTDFEMLKHIPRMISDEQKAELHEFQKKKR